MSEPATPLPWKRDSYFIVGEVPNGRPGGEVIVRCGATVPQLRDSVRDEKNAAYIVEACNTYQNLKAENSSLVAEVFKLDTEISDLKRVPPCVRCGEDCDREFFGQHCEDCITDLLQSQSRLAELQKPCVWTMYECKPVGGYYVGTCGFEFSEHEIRDWMKFCPYCGHPIQEQESSDGIT